MLILIYVNSDTRNICSNINKIERIITYEI